MPRNIFELNVLRSQDKILIKTCGNAKIFARMLILISHYEFEKRNVAKKVANNRFGRSNSQEAIDHGRLTVTILTCDDDLTHIMMS